MPLTERTGRCLSASKRMAHFVVCHGTGYVQRFVAAVLQPKREIEVFGTERIEREVESVQLSKNVGPYHHRTAARDTRRRRVELTVIDLIKSYWTSTSPPEANLTTSTVVNPLRLPKRAQLRLHLAYTRIVHERVDERVYETRRQNEVIVEEEEKRGTEQLCSELGGGVAAASHAKILLAPVGMHLRIVFSHRVETPSVDPLSHTRMCTLTRSAAVKLFNARRVVTR